VLVAHGPPGGVDLTDNEAVEDEIRKFIYKADVVNVVGY